MPIRSPFDYDVAEIEVHTRRAHRVAAIYDGLPVARGLTKAQRARLRRLRRLCTVLGALVETTATPPTSGPLKL